MARKSPFGYTNIRFRYLFLKSKKHAAPKRMLYGFPELILFLFIASTFDAKTPSKAHYDLEVEIKQHSELFTDQYIKISEIIRSTNLREQCSLHAQSKLKFSKRLWYFKHLLLLREISTCTLALSPDHAWCASDQSKKERFLVISVVCGFIRNANPLQAWVMNFRLYVTNA